MPLRLSGFRQKMKRPAFAACLILCLALIGLFVYRTTLHQAERNWAGEVHSDLVKLDEWLTRTIVSAKDDARLLARNLQTNLLDGPDGGRYLQQYLKAVRRTNELFGHVTVATSDGKLLQSNIWPNGGISEDPRSSASYIQAMSANGEPVVTAPYRSADGRFVLSVAAATPDRLGVVEMSVPLDELYAAFARHETVTSGELYIVGIDGKPAPLRPGAPSGPTFAGFAAGGSSGTDEAVIAQMTNAESGLTLINVMNLKTAAAAGDPAPKMPIVVAVLLALVLLAVLLLAKRYIRLIRFLIDAMRRMKRDDWQDRMNPPADGEIAKPYDTIDCITESLRSLVYYDTLTLLPNRAHLNEILDRELQTAAFEKSEIAVLFIDLDNFKRINDSKGHSFGDELLRQAANRIRECVPSSGTVCRFGGDEFVIVLPYPNRQHLLPKTLNRLQQSFENGLPVFEHTVYMKLSIGAAMFPKDGLTAEELLKHADAAMYKAKDLGKNNVQFYHSGMKEQLLKRTRLEELLLSGLYRGEFEVVYQPQIVARTGQLRGFEALLRWNCPELGQVSPADFIPIAEETGAIVPIGEFVLREACRMNGELYRRFGLQPVMSVNVSPVQLKQVSFADRMIHIIRESGIPAERMELEMTENTVIDTIDTSLEWLKRMQSFGVKLAMDDFGTGYSSLSYLIRLPIHTLKIDKSFVRDMGKRRSHSILESIIQLAQRSGFKVVAEGIERSDQLQRLREWGCDYLQGYYFSKPLTADQMEEYVRLNCSRQSTAGVTM